MNDIPILLEHIDLLDSLNRLDIHFLQGGLEFLVVSAAGLVHFFGFPAGSSLASEGASVSRGR
jgi:hypothetical protein